MQWQHCSHATLDVARCQCHIACCLLLRPVCAAHHHYAVCPEAAGVECAADVLLTAAARLEGLMLRAEGTLPMLRLAAGLAHGSSFIDYEGATAAPAGIAIKHIFVFCDHSRLG